jgi:sterol desaturase/sphingolipid hydroxylase (fatty acid hydroxylase superfamily)
VPNLPDVVTWSIPGFLLLIIVEVWSFRFHRDDDELGYDPKDTTTSLTMGLGSIFFDILWKIPALAVYVALYELTPLRIHLSWWTLPLILVAQDFFYYWSHRCHHLVRVLWASHVVHHSSQRFNLSTALRQTWTGFTSFVFYIPMILAGVHPGVLAFCQSVNLVYQFWIHTERIDRLPAPVEAVFNTPSHHRVHHASQGSYLDRNFAGMLIIWDRMFGSFEPEGERPQYGLTHNIETYNPVRVAFHEYASIGHDLRIASGWRQRLGLLVHKPGWSPEPVPALAGAGSGEGTRLDDSALEGAG